MSTSTIFEAAVSARDVGHFSEAESLLLSIKEVDRTPAYYVVLGDVSQELGKLDQAIESFRQAVDLVPNAEVVSLGLFHSLWEANRRDDAFEEMKRFLKNNESREYSQLLADMKAELDHGNQ